MGDVVRVLAKRGFVETLNRPERSCSAWVQVLVTEEVAFLLLETLKARSEAPDFVSYVLFRNLVSDIPLTCPKAYLTSESSKISNPVYEPQLLV